MKLPKNYVAGTGVVKATAFGGIGQRLMEKQGWNKGQGLGKDKGGMTEALEVKEKKDTLGVGANGCWDWTHKFWEDAYNSAAQGIDHQGGGSSDSSSSSSSSDDDEDTGGRGRRVRRKAPATKTPTKPATKHKKASSSNSSDSASSDSSSSSSDSDSDSDGGPAAKAGAAGKKGKQAAVHRDGTVASGASAAELAIAAELAKDPWGRWGGKAGKMARIRQQEAGEAEKARQKLGLARAAGVVGGQRAPLGSPVGAAAAGAGKAEGAADGAVKRERIVITLTIAEDVTIKRGAFVRTPATGWWGATYFASAGAMEGMEEAREHVAKERKMFNEDDQASLYMQAHEHQRVGRKGLGKSNTINVAGGKWEGSKTTFDDDAAGAHDKPQDGTGGQAAAGQQGDGLPAQEEPVAKTGKGAKKGKRKASSGAVEETAAVAAAGSEAAAQGEEPVADAGLAGAKEGKRKKKKQKGEQQQEEAAGGAGQTAAAAADDPVACGGSAAKAAGERPPIKWLKVAKVLLKQAPKRRLRLEKLCRQMLQHTAADEQDKGSPGLPHTMSHEKLTSLLHKKAKKSKVVIQDGVVSLPA